MGELLLRREAWSGLMMGNHALARAMIEAGVRVATTYPGSPTPEIAVALTSIPEGERPFYFEYSVNEKVALEIAAGASLNGHLSACFFKSVGLNVVADTLIQLSLMELIGGLVVVLGDDPGANSSQNEQDNRHFARMSYIPMLEPASPQELHDMFREAARLSVAQRAPVFVRMTTHVAHAKEVVGFEPLPEGAYDWKPRFDAANGPYVPVTETVFPLKRRALQKLVAFEAIAEASPFNVVHRPQPPADDRSGMAEPRRGAGGPSVRGGALPTSLRRGVIVSALPRLAVLENLEESGAPVDVLALGMSYPLPRKLVLEFLAAHDEVLVIEELDRVVEPEVKAMAWDAGARCRIHARRDPEDLMGELGPERTWKLMSEVWPELFPAGAYDLAALALPGVPGAAPPPVVKRLPQLCPGCGHRSAFHAVRKAIPPGTITVADIGCHSMAFLPPYRMGEVLFCMGHATATGSGLALRNDTRKVMAFMGDSTLFHAALPGVINAIVRNHNLTLVLLENGTTAMTGHQPRAGSGEIGERIPLVEMFKVFGARFVRDVDAYSQTKLIETLKEAMAFPGFALVIARHPCMLKFMREQRAKRPDLRPAQVRIDPETCDRLHVCVSEFGCPSFVLHDDGRVSVHEDLCIGDGSCLQTCPVQAIVRPAKEATP
jgi:indolepyruvate ferredoxin oxidoreductase alpha subunit